MATRTKEEQLLILGLNHPVPIDAFNNITNNTKFDVDALCDDLEFHYRRNNKIEDVDNDTFISSVRDNQVEIKDDSIPEWKFGGYDSEADWTAQAYARKRKAEYPSNGDQWDMVYKDMKNSTTTHADAVEAIKTKWPKDNTGPVE